MSQSSYDLYLVFLSLCIMSKRIYIHSLRDKAAHLLCLMADDFTRQGESTVT